MAPSSTCVPWPDALCNGDPSTFLEPVRNTASATYISIVPNTPTMDSTYGTFSTYTASVFTDTSQQCQLCTSTSSFYTEIAEAYVIPGSKFYCQRRIYMQTNRNPTSGAMET